MEGGVTLSHCTKTAINYNVPSPSPQHHASNSSTWSFCQTVDGRIDQRLVGIYIFKEYRSNCRRDGIYGILRCQDSGTSKKYVSARSYCNVLYVLSTLLSIEWILNREEYQTRWGHCRQVEKTFITWFISVVSRFLTFISQFLTVITWIMTILFWLWFMKVKSGSWREKWQASIPKSESHPKTALSPNSNSHLRNWN